MLGSSEELIDGVRGSVFVPEFNPGRNPGFLLSSLGQVSFPSEVGA
jgi:hypothetical protein